MPSLVSNLTARLNTSRCDRAEAEHHPLTVPKGRGNSDTVSYPTVNAGGWLKANPREPDDCAGAAGAGGFAPKVNTPWLFGKVKLELLLPNWNTEPGDTGGSRREEKS